MHDPAPETDRHDTARRAPGGSSPRAPIRDTDRTEWPTVALLVATYALWAGALALAALSLPAAIALAALTMALHGSLTHEAVHGHPTPNPRLNAALVWPVLGLLVPYARFRDQHLAHHRDANLTDPYDDPESNYLDPAVWVRLPRWLRVLLRANNTLLGRITLGPAIGQIAFVHGEWRAARAGDRAVVQAWRAHVLPVALVLALVALSTMPLWAYLVAAYAASGLLRIRTFLEHRAHAHSAGRTVVIEDRGPLAFLFLNNNFHLVHHMHPGVAWYRLPTLYFANRARYVERNSGYVYRSYGQILARHLLRAKDPVPHPLWPQPLGADRSRPLGDLVQPLLPLTMLPQTLLPQTLLSQTQGVAAPPVAGTSDAASLVPLTPGTPSAP